MAPKWASSALEWAPMAPAWASAAPEWASTAPEWSSLAPRWSSMAPEWASASDEWAYIVPEWISFVSEWASLATGWTSTATEWSSSARNEPLLLHEQCCGSRSVSNSQIQICIRVKSCSVSLSRWKARSGSGFMSKWSRSPTLLPRWTSLDPGWPSSAKNDPLQLQNYEYVMLSDKINVIIQWIALSSSHMIIPNIYKNLYHPAR